MNKEISLESIAANATAKLLPRHAWEVVSVNELGQHLAADALDGEISVQPTRNHIVTDCCCDVKNCHAKENRQPRYAHYKIGREGAYSCQKIKVRAVIGIVYQVINSRAKIVSKEYNRNEEIRSNKINIKES